MLNKSGQQASKGARAPRVIAGCPTPARLCFCAWGGEA